MATQDTSRRSFIIKLASVSGTLATGSMLSACGGGSDSLNMVQFNYGVASGDPLINKVILWTHAKYQNSNDPVALKYEVATDVAFSNVVSSGATTASEATSFTAKVDATGLAPATDYYYRFKSDVWISPVGRTRTLPTGTVSEVKLAVFSCSSYAHGHFHVYGEASKSDAQYALHLGDYIYEYKDGEYPETAKVVLGRNVLPANEILSLSDYRKRHALYKSDVNLKQLHARMPMIAVWDDHEFTNDTYMAGAQNHTEGAEGTFADRKAAALQAYHEWMPIRTGADKSVIYRSFDFGNLLSLHMLDTRLIGREKQLDQTALKTLAGQQAWMSTSRQLMGTTQTQWLQNAMTTSTAKWQVLGQQVVMAATRLPVNVQFKFQAYFDAPNLATVSAIVSEVAAYKAALASGNPSSYLTAENLPVPYNFDAWDGYPAARETVLATFAGIAAQQPALAKKLVVLSGDSHNAWHTDLKLLDGTKVGEEFATSSITSPGWESYFPSLIPTIKSLFEDSSAFSNVKWMDASRRGYLKMTFTAAQAKGEFIFVDAVNSGTYKVATSDAAETRTYAG